MDLDVVKYFRLSATLYELPATLIYNNVTTHIILYLSFISKLIINLTLNTYIIF